MKTESESPNPADSAGIPAGSSVENRYENSPENISDIAAIETTDLTRAFGNLTAVDGVSIKVAQGEIFGLIGPNGAGKSTLIKMITTLLPPTSGSALVAGFDIVRNPAAVRRHIGYVPQSLSSDRSLTGYENLILSARLYAVPRAERAERVAAALEMMKLADAADRMVQTYSGGMIRRLEIAQSVIHHPEVLVMDEPTVGLDPLARRTVWEHIEQLRETFGTTVLVTTHDMGEARALCERIALMHGGRIKAIGSADELMRQVGAGATLDDVFVHFTGATIDSAGDYREARAARRSARQHA